MSIPNKIAFLFLSIILSVSVSSLFTEEIKTIAVAGFINQGVKTDDPINKVISKSLITYLGKIGGVRVTPFAIMEKLAAENKFWKSKKLDIETAVEMGLSLKAERVVTGTYKVDAKNNTIEIIVYIYDPVTDKLKLQREYSGDAGVEIFDTIDRLIRNISIELVGHPVYMGNLEVEISSDSAYSLLINKNFQKKITRQDGFKEIEPAEEPIEVSIVIPETGREVYHDTITLRDGENRDITYAPSGVIVVKAGSPGINVFADDFHGR